MFKLLVNYFSIYSVRAVLYLINFYVAHSMKSFVQAVSRHEMGGGLQFCYHSFSSSFIVVSIQIDGSSMVVLIVVMQ